MSRAIVFLFLLLVFFASVGYADAWNPYMGCRMACNAAYLSCMNVYGELNFLHNLQFDMAYAVG